VTDEDYLKVLAGKMVTLTEEDCMSYGAAARGHILEPYAIEALNKTLESEQGVDHETFYWWDDILVRNRGRQLAFSPDAMNMPMELVDDIDKVTAIAEVKSYEASKHLSTAYMPKNQIEERWQIASAMALLPNIDHAYLVLFNPKLKFRKTFVIRFDREELKSEIDLILQTETKWKKFREEGPMTREPENGAIHSHYGGNEVSIMKEVEAQQLLNPVVSKE
jgi:hypothetical protein